MQILLRSALVSLLFSTASFGQEFTDEFIGTVNSIAKRKLSVAYPDFLEWQKKLIDEIPRLSGNETTQEDFDDYRRRLERHGRMTEDLNSLLLEVCVGFNEVDKEAQALAKIKWITQGYYEEIKSSIIESKKNCDADNKQGRFWTLYDDATNERAFLESRIDLKIAECKRDHPDTCL